MRALAFSTGKDSMACLHLMLGDLDCAIYVDTGFAYPESRALVEYADTLVPVVVVKSERAAQNEAEGLPADVVPIDWTTLGQTLHVKQPYKIQSYLGCCYQNITEPIYRKAAELGATELVFGQRKEESRKSPARNGDVIFGITRLQPIEDWTTQQVLDFLATKMRVPEHYRLKHSSLDCYDCTGFRRDSSDRIEWMMMAHPDLYDAYFARRKQVDAAIRESLHGY